MAQPPKVFEQKAVDVLDYDFDFYAVLRPGGIGTDKIASDEHYDIAGHVPCITHFECYVHRYSSEGVLPGREDRDIVYRWCDN